MLAATLSSFWPTAAREDVAPIPPRKRAPPVFIGDAVQPFMGETMLLSILRAEEQAAQEDDN